MKRRAFLLIAFFVLLSIAAQADTYAFYNTEIDGLYYSLDKSAKTAKLSWMKRIEGPGGESFRGINYSGDLVIPETVEYEGSTYEVDGIDHDVFEDCQFESLTIPPSIVSIDSNAFGPNYNSTIKNLCIPSWDWWFGIKKPGAWSDFLLDDLVNDLLEKADHLFVDGVEYDISEFVFPESMDKVPKDAFRGCSKLKKVTMHDSMKEIGEYAFYGTGLTTVVIPASVESIQKKAFSDCNDLVEFTISNGVKYLGVDVFKGSPNLERLTIESNVDLQGMQYPINAPNLQVIVSRITAPKDIPSSLFSNYYNNVTLYVPEGTKEAYLSCEGWKEFATIKEGDIRTGLESNFGHGLTSKAAISVPTIYDLQGRRLTESPAKGIYIKNGKKVIVK